jgi:uroporphyrin-III C-methyltransferase
MIGTVYLVGAGPGDPDLLTVKAHRLLEDADVVLYDSLTTDEILERCEASTVVNVGKKSDGDGRTTQEEIDHLMVRHARSGKTVVRLKGGDPTVFGRGGEEAEHLAAAGVPFEIVPGVSSVLAPGSVGIPLTHREHASSLTVVTGHEDPTKEESALDWDALARTVEAGGTLVILMGVGRLPDNVAALQERGLAPETPVAMVERASRPEEFTLTATLGSVVERSREVGIEPPALTIVGDVVSVRDRVVAFLGGSAAETGTTATGERTPVTDDGGD